MQTKRESMIEAGLNTGSAFILSMILAELLFPILFAEGDVTSVKNAFAVGCFTVLSLARNYVWRRYFNHRLIKRLAEMFDD